MSKKFTISLIIFLALVAVVNVILDRSFKAFSVHNTLNNMMDKQFAEFDTTFTYLAMGNSHNCINTHILPCSFNYGSPSENYIQSYYKLKHILEETGKKPEYLILQSDPSSFGYKSSDRYEYNSYWIKYIDYIELAKVKKDKDVLGKWLEGSFFSYVGNYKDIQLSIVYRAKFKNVEMYHGYRPHRDYNNFANEPDRQKVARNKAQLISSKGKYFDNTVSVYFEKIIQICQEHGVKVVLVRIPMTREFNEEEAKLVPVDSIYARVDSIASKYQVYQGLLDYHEIFSNYPEFFYDPDHLNVKGSDLFTEQLAKDLETYRSAGFPE
jgi:hypothetical protein